MSRLGFDASAELCLDVARTTPDDGAPHFVEAILKDVDGKLELGLWDEEGVEVGSVRFSHGVLAEWVKEARQRAEVAA